MTYETHDSGERAKYDSGMVRDTNKGKPRFDLCLPLDCPHHEQMLTRFAALMARGAEKYGDRNWERAEGSEELTRFRDSAFRHFMMWINGVNDGEDHAAAVFFNITAAEYVKRKLKGAQWRKRHGDAARWGRVQVLDEGPDDGGFLPNSARAAAGMEPCPPGHVIKFHSTISADDVSLAKKIVTALNDYKRRGGRIA